MHLRLLKLMFFLLLAVVWPCPTAESTHKNNRNTNRYTYKYWSAALATWRSGRRAWSLLHSLMSRVATLRASRGDSAGAQRAARIAEGLESSVTWWRMVGSLGWDYIAHYRWEDFSDYAEIMSYMNDLLSACGELTRTRSEAEKVGWISQNYKRIYRISKSLLHKLLTVFTRSGPLRESILAIQKEITEGDLIADLLQFGAADVKGLLQVVKDMISRFFVPPPMQQEYSDGEL